MVKKSHNFQILRVNFWVHIPGLGQIDHEESENRGPETQGSILRAPGPKKKLKMSKT